jgi:hypothetical protein
MSWLAFHRTEAADQLQRHHPNAMLLLTLIARRARFVENPCPIHGTEFGEARIGDHEAAGLTRQEYRTALSVLEKRKFVTIKSTSKGTIAKIVERCSDTAIYSISKHSLQPSIQPSIQPEANHQPTISQPLNKKVRKIEGEEIPLPFTSERFAQSWEDWKQFRIQSKKKLTPLSITKQFKTLASIGESRAIAAIDHSIANGYQGIYEPKRDTSKIQQQEFKASDVGI